MHQKKWKNFLFIILISVIAFSCDMITKAKQKPSLARPEVIYHIFQRSFYDSNGDQIGDLAGLEQKLNYLQDLGVTSILLLPLYESVYYHNYYSGDFEKIDSAFGTKDDYLSLVKAIHGRGMKVYMDMEMQYVTEDHLWYKSALGNPDSPFSDYILFEDSSHATPATFVFNLRGWTGYDGVYKKIVTVNLKNKDVLNYNIRLFKYWVDPNKDGKFDDGVDGFRFDHMMNKLDNKPQLTGLFQSFWLPLITEIKKANPDLTLIAEQADWATWGEEYINAGVADKIFSFKLMGAIRSFNKKYLEQIADSAFSIFPDNVQQLVFIENHDMPRFSYQVNRSIPKMKIGAVLNILSGGTPSIYYGQEIGMHGAGFWGKWGMNDGNEIPEREAFEWYKADTGRGLAIWYKDSGPWWDSTNLKPDDGISVEEQAPDSNSPLNFYKKIISIKSAYPVVTYGKYQTISNNNDSVYSYQRFDGQHALMVVINLSGQWQNAVLNNEKLKFEKVHLTQLAGSGSPGITSEKITFNLPPYGIEVWDYSK